jgi:peroxiredoxin
MKNQLFSFVMLLLLGVSLSLASCNAGAETAQESTATAAAEEPADKPKPQKQFGLKVGDTAPDFKLKNIDGNMVSLADFADAKGYIVTFTCNTCPYSVAYEDRIIALHNQFAPLGYPVIAVQPNDPAIKTGDSYEKMQERAASKQFPFPYLMDDGSVTPVYGATRTPEIYLLDKDLTVRYTGAIDDNAQNASAVQAKYVELAVEALEAGKTPEPDFVKAIGCGIQPRQAKQS